MKYKTINKHMAGHSILVNGNVYEVDEDFIIHDVVKADAIKLGKCEHWSLVSSDDGDADNDSGTDTASAIEPETDVEPESADTFEATALPAEEQAPTQPVLPEVAEKPKMKKPNMQMSRRELIQQAKACGIKAGVQTKKELIDLILENLSE